jgi:integrase/recombinase XerD
MLKRLARKAGIQKRVFAHAFRHTLASEYTKSGGETLMLREVLGHTDVRTTQRYKDMWKSILTRWCKAIDGTAR